jgi:hypothetical protein
MNECKPLPGGVEVGSGTRLPVGRGNVYVIPLSAGTWTYCSGRVRAIARGMRIRVGMPLKAGNWRC